MKNTPELCLIGSAVNQEKNNSNNL